MVDEAPIQVKEKVKDDAVRRERIRRYKLWAILACFVLAILLYIIAPIICIATKE